MTPREARFERTTGETSVRLTLNLDGRGDALVRTGVPFLDHMLTSLAKHARFDLDLEGHGDLEVDEHHLIEDCALALGAALDRALGTRSGVRRFGSAYAPMDESLARAVVDLSGRPFAVVEIGDADWKLGGLSGENTLHFLSTLAFSARLTLHADLLRGGNAHHRVEALFKALALALNQATRPSEGDDVPSTKGVLG